LPIKRKTKQTKKVKPKIARTSRKITKQHKDKISSRENKGAPYKPDDYCFYLTSNNKAHFASVQSVHEHDGTYYYVLIDQFDFRFITVEHKYCADDEKELKGVKRQR
jgi:predicted ribosome-associated RNA-binding protein Tma20